MLHCNMNVRRSIHFFPEFRQLGAFALAKAAPGSS
jgi:hypothetical protein